jgi:hypothetical protein
MRSTGGRCITACSRASGRRSSFVGDPPCSPRDRLASPARGIYAWEANWGSDHEGFQDLSCDPGLHLGRDTDGAERPRSKRALVERRTGCAPAERTCTKGSCAADPRAAAACAAGTPDTGATGARAAAHVRTADARVTTFRDACDCGPTAVSASPSDRTANLPGPSAGRGSGGYPGRVGLHGPERLDMGASWIDHDDGRSRAVRLPLRPVVWLGVVRVAVGPRSLPLRPMGMGPAMGRSLCPSWLGGHSRLRR